MIDSKKAVINSKFKDAFTRIGWQHSNANSGKYDIWTHPENSNLWTVIPKEMDTVEYKLYQQKNIKMLLYAMELPENDFYFNEIYNQLLGYNYKLISRIETSAEFQDDSVPYELASILPNKSIDSFRTFYYTKTGGKSNIPIDKFEMNHTQHGSFIIPVSISAEVNDSETLFATPSTTNVVLREYLTKIDTLTKIAREEDSNADSFAEKVMSENIDSKIVRDFLNKADSIAKYKEKYQDRIKEMSISSKGSPILDFKLKAEEKVFKEVDLGSIKVLPDDFLPTLEKMEIEADDSSINERHAEIEVSVDTLSQGGTVKFVVYSINNKKLKKPIIGTSVELAHVNLEFCIDVFKDKDLVIVTGDIMKAKGKAGKIIPEQFKLKPRIMGLFDEEEDTNE